jgi:hypothetical protein
MNNLESIIIDITKIINNTKILRIDLMKWKFFKIELLMLLIC